MTNLLEHIHFIHLKLDQPIVGIIRLAISVEMIFLVVEKDLFL